MISITTTNFNVELSGYWDDAAHSLENDFWIFYRGMHNYIKAQKKSQGIQITSIGVNFQDAVTGAYYAYTYQLDEDGYVVIDISSILKSYSSNFTMTIDGTLYRNGLVVDGIHPDAYCSLINMSGDCLYQVGSLYKKMVLPNTIYKLENSNVVLPCGYAFSDYTLTGFTIAYNMATISANLIKAAATLGSVHWEWSRRLKTPTEEIESGNTFVKIDCACAIGASPEDNLHLLNNASFYLQVISGKVDTIITDLQTYGDGYKSFNEFSEQITIGLRGCTAYDYAYYSLLLLTANDIKIDNEPCELVTKSANIPTGNRDKYNLEITLKRKNYVTI